MIKCKGHLQNDSLSRGSVKLNNILIIPFYKTSKIGSISTTTQMEFRLYTV
jgi:hypothetical protein